MLIKKKSYNLNTDFNEKEKECGPSADKNEEKEDALLKIIHPKNCGIICFFPHSECSLREIIF